MSNLEQHSEMKKSDIFFRNRETLDQGNQIFSVGGTPSFRLNRRGQQTSNVFPAGCMGSRSGEEIAAEAKLEAEAKEEFPGDIVKDEVMKDMGYDPQEACEKEDDKKVEDMPEVSEGYVWKRNPLTGEGVEMEQQKSHKRGMRKRLTKWVW